ncbi:MAG TPA: type II toxin-antitoxin system VapC family toxin [Treponema sp.]|nr:type II toxin-antitoxin system VapC family toxin [Treponema sp.]
MIYVLDTCVLSETIKPQPNATVVAWLRKQKQEQLFVTTLSLGELRKGIDRLDASTKKHQLLVWLATLADNYQRRFLDFDQESAMLWGSICAQCEQAGTPVPVIDSLIAACTLRHGGTLVTRNEKDYLGTGVIVFNPWNET